MSVCAWESLEGNWSAKVKSILTQNLLREGAKKNNYSFKASVHIYKISDLNFCTKLWNNQIENVRIEQAIGLQRLLIIRACINWTQRTLQLNFESLFYLSGCRLSVNLLYTLFSHKHSLWFSRSLSLCFDKEAQDWLILYETRCSYKP